MDRIEGDTSPDRPGAAAEDAPSSSPDRAVVPIPGSPRRQLPASGTARPGGSFWQRIGLPGRQSLSKADRHEVLLSRLSELEGRLSESQRAIEDSIAKLDHRLTQVWEVEEQLSYLLEIQQILTGLRDQQRDLGERVRSNRRALNVLAVLLLAAIAIVAVALDPWGTFL
jgi:hypothetical protein